VAPQKIPQAVARFEAASYGAAVAGPPLGAALFSLGQALPFAADAISYAGSFACTWFVRSAMATGPRPSEISMGSSRPGSVGSGGTA
jgi:hypothetical protein